MLTDVVSRRELDVLASMCIAQLPFPPMPLCVLRGSECSDGICSSHDLLATAISVHYTACRLQPLTAEDERVRMEKKRDILVSLQRMVHDAVARSASVQEIYETFQQHFRQYMQLYQACGDLRFKPIEFVERGGPLVQQAKDHVAGMGIIESCMYTIASSGYDDVITAYAQILHSYGLGDDVEENG